jgi:hypothetical protein
VIDAEPIHVELARRILVDCDDNLSGALFKAEAEARYDRTGIYRLAAKELRRMMREGRSEP